ncbi:UPF0755 protein [Butyrivibrio sp. INlla18]|uniref:endolytic transglycosylase MltG n=1 Tax=Butyrivibrio sp. INlla18 TaxID=1520806 RepID=UPI0008869643|nr:endolytic transglycosylase MltG [Butyrivibrio sp. INlla18]SDA43745.1 UPF0755 protein [Butyrivibrio sp. INlla18]
MNTKKLGLGILDTVVKIVFIIIVAMLIIKYAKVAYNYGYHIFNQTAVSSGTGREVTVTISEGDSVGQIADKLAEVGLITDKLLFKLQERFSEYHGMEQPGTYTLSTAMTPEEMLSVMSGGIKNGEEASGEEDAIGEGATEETEVTEETQETQETEAVENSEESNGD